MNYLKFPQNKNEIIDLAKEENLTIIVKCSKGIDLDFNLQDFLKENQISFEIFQTGRYLPAILKKYILDSNYDIVEKHHNKNEKTVTNKKLFGSPISGVFYKNTSHPSQDYISSYNEIVKKYNFKVYEEEYENFIIEIEKLIKDFKLKSNKPLPYVGSYPTWIKLL